MIKTARGEGDVVMLWRKFSRHQRNKGAYLASITIILIGLMVYSSFSIVLDSLISAQQVLYRAKLCGQLCRGSFHASVGGQKLRSLEASRYSRPISQRGSGIEVGNKTAIERRYLSPPGLRDPTNRAINVLSCMGGPKNETMNIWVNSQFCR